MTSATPLAVLIGALGGQGGGVLAEWLVETASNAGYAAQGTSIPGVAQRTGATTYYVEVFPAPLAALGGRRPVLGLYPVPGHVDLVVASELLEAVRIVQSGMVSPERTTLIASTARALTTIEKMVPGDGRVDPTHLQDVARAQCRRLVAFDMDATARDAGAVVSAVMLGAIAASGVLPFARGDYETVVRDSGVGGDASLRGFAGGFDALGANAPGADASARADAPRADAAPDIVALGAARLTDYQDARYADLYRERLAPVDDAERAIDPRQENRGALMRETARFLALWMAFDDVVRVASLKCRASRFARVRREVGAQEGDIVRIVDHFKPGLPELAGLLPPALATRLVAWDRRRQVRGRAPLALPLHVRADSVSGFIALRALAALRRWRRRGARYAEEQRAIERWLAAVHDAAKTDWQVAFELAQCGRLIKGYGATNERGKRNLAHIVEHLADGTRLATPAAHATSIRQAREAALADEAGTALDAALARHGAPPRPIVPVPIRWQRRPQQRAAEAANES
ncbi:MAG: indolepyruvate oxidoreductase subunit beta family protein [Casimicrobiaceae bacterium]